MAIISIGSTIIHEPEIGRPDTEAKAIGHNLWNDYISLQMHREAARKLWIRIRGLEAKINTHRSNHTSKAIERAQDRIESLRERVLIEQHGFLQAEWEANARWGALSPQQRKEEWVDQLFDLPPDQESILGLWWREVGQSEAPDPQFALDARVYAFISPEHAKVYADRWAWYSPDTDMVPDTVTPKGGRRRRRQG